LTDCRDQTDASEGSHHSQLPRAEPPPPGLVHLKDHPELIPVVMRAVDEVIDGRLLTRERNAGLIDDIEQAAAAAALANYERMAETATEVSEVAAEARRDRARSVAASAEAIAERVADTAAEVHTVEEALADRLAAVAANAASELAARVGLDDETAASVAAALVVRAVSAAAAVDADARAGAASSVAQAAAGAAAGIAKEAASTASAAGFDVITAALARHQVALETCYEAAAAAAREVLTHQSGADQERHPSELRREPA